MTKISSRGCVFKNLHHALSQEPTIMQMSSFANEMH